MEKKKRANTEVEPEVITAEEQQQGGANGVQEIWRFFSSMKLGLALLLIISVASVVGTLLPQNPETRMPLYDIYGSIWYRSLLAVLCLNLVVCSLNRLKFIKRSLGVPKTKVSDNFLKKLANYTVIKERVTETTAATNLTTALKGQGYRVFTETEDGTTYVVGDKGRYGVLGSFITHIAFVVIALGAIIGNVTGFESYLMALEGNTYTFSSDVVRNAFAVDPADDFKIKVNDFTVKYQSDGWTPKDYLSDLSVLDNNGKEVERKIIEVNTPLVVNGVKFYQSSFGPVVDVKYVGSDGQNQTFTVQEGDTLPLPGTDEQLTIMRYNPDYNPNNPMQPNSQEPKNPAVVYRLIKAGQAQDIQVQMFNKAMNVTGGTVEFAGRYYTGLSVRRDPGVPTVIFGCIVLTLGTFLSLFWQHRKIWGVIKQHNNMVTIELGGVTEKNKLALENDFNRIVDKTKS